MRAPPASSAGFALQGSRGGATSSAARTLLGPRARPRTPGDERLPRALLLPAFLCPVVEERWCAVGFRRHASSSTQPLVATPEPSEAPHHAGPSRASRNQSSSSSWRGPASRRYPGPLSRAQGQAGAGKGNEELDQSTGDASSDEHGFFSPLFRPQQSLPAPQRLHRPSLSSSTASPATTTPAASAPSLPAPPFDKAAAMSEAYRATITAMLSQGSIEAAARATSELLRRVHSDVKGKMPALDQPTLDTIFSVTLELCPRADTRSGYVLAEERVEELAAIVAALQKAGVLEARLVDVYIRGLLSIQDATGRFRTGLQDASAMLGVLVEDSVGVTPEEEARLGLCALLLSKELRISENSIKAGRGEASTAEGRRAMAKRHLAALVSVGELLANPAVLDRPWALPRGSADDLSETALRNALPAQQAFAGLLRHLLAAPNIAAHLNSHSRKQRGTVVRQPTVLCSIESSLDIVLKRCAAATLPNNAVSQRIFTTLLNHQAQRSAADKPSYLYGLGALLRAMARSKLQPDPAFLNVLLRGAETTGSWTLAVTAFDAGLRESRAYWRAEVRGLRDGGEGRAWEDDDDEGMSASWILNVSRRLSPTELQVEVALARQDAHRLTALLRLITSRGLFQTSPRRDAPASSSLDGPAPVDPDQLAEESLRDAARTNVQSLVLRLLPFLETNPRRLRRRRLARYVRWGGSLVMAPELPALNDAVEPLSISPFRTSTRSSAAPRRTFLPAPADQDHAVVERMEAMERVALQPRVLTELLRLCARAGLTGLAERVWRLLLREGTRSINSQPAPSILSSRPLCSVKRSTELPIEAATIMLQLYQREARTRIPRQRNGRRRVSRQEEEVRLDSLRNRRTEQLVRTLQANRLSEGSQPAQTVPPQLSALGRLTPRMLRMMAMRSRGAPAATMPLAQDRPTSARTSAARSADVRGSRLFRSRSKSSRGRYRATTSLQRMGWGWALSSARRPSEAELRLRRALTGSGTGTLHSRADAAVLSAWAVYEEVQQRGVKADRVFFESLLEVFAKRLRARASSEGQAALRGKARMGVLDVVVRVLKDAREEGVSVGREYTWLRHVARRWGRMGGS